MKKGYEKDRQNVLPVLRIQNLQLYYIAGLLAAGALNDLVADGLTLFQSLETIGLNSGEVYEYIFAVFTGDKTVTFLRIEPLNRTLVHVWYLHINF